MWIHWVKVELLLVEKQWEQHGEFENLDTTTLDKGFLRLAGVLLSESAFALLKDGNPDKRIKVISLLKQASEKCQGMGADRYVKIIEDKKPQIS